MGNLEIKERYANFYTDFAFKKFFGTEANKDILISFLNSLFDGQEVVEDLEYLNGEQLGPTALERKAVFDVYCRNDKGDRFLIEMQKADQNYFKDRSIYYSTFPIQEQAVKGSWNFRLDKVYTIGILNFTFDDNAPDYYHHEVQLMDTHTKKVFYDKLTYIYIEMPKFQKTEEELETLFDNNGNLEKTLINLGFNKKGIIDKQRSKYLYDNKYEISLDNVKDIGLFIEIEVKRIDKDKIIEYANLLQLLRYLNIDINLIDDKRYYDYL